MGRPRKPHGTPAAYRAHKRDGTRICDACQAFKDARTVENPLKGDPTPPAQSRQAPRKPPAEPENPRGRSKRRIDPLGETFDNLDTVQAALDLALSDDIARVPALSKRKSELIAEIVALGGVVPAESEQPKKLEALLDGPVGGDRGDNVIGFRQAKA